MDDDSFNGHEFPLSSWIQEQEESFSADHDDYAPEHEVVWPKETEETAAEEDHSNEWTQEETNKGNKRRVVLLAITLLAMVVIGVAIGVPVAAAKNNQSSSGNNSSNAISNDTSNNVTPSPSVTMEPSSSTEPSKSPSSTMEPTVKATPTAAPTVPPTVSSTPLPTKPPTGPPIASPATSVPTTLTPVTFTPTTLAPATNAPTPGAPPPPPPNFATGTWMQLGQNLYGQAGDDYFGRSIVLSKSATVMAVGAGQAFEDPGYVQVFRLVGSSWMQRGQDLVGQASGDSFGRSLALNHAGTILAVGAHRNDGNGEGAGHVVIFEFNQNTNAWMPLGNDIEGLAPFDEFGASVSLSGDGYTLAVGATSAETSNGAASGAVRVFTYTANAWTQVGQTLIGQAPSDYFGNAVSLSRDGTIVAVGARWHDASARVDAGQVNVYQYSSTAWIPMGPPLDGPLAEGRFGTSLELDDSGLIVAVGSPGFFGSFVGSVFVYEYSNTEWRQRGQALISDQMGDFFGRSLSLNHDGTMVAVGIPERDANGLTNSGQVRVFHYNNNQWSRVGNPLNGEAEFDRFGESVSIANHVVGVGAIWHDGNGELNAGYARAFQLN